jgi:predicted dinucleotide-binding enzyme
LLRVARPAAVERRQGVSSKLATAIGGAASVAVDNRTALQGADAVAFALRFSVLKDVIDEIARRAGEGPLVIPSNPVRLDAKGEIARLLPEGRSSGDAVVG